MHRVKTLVSLGLVLSVISGRAVAEEVLKKTTRGNPGIRSINVISFAPGGVLFIGDGTTSRIVAVRTGDASPQGGLTKKINAFDKELAGRLGAGPDDVEFLDMAVNPASGKAYFAVRKQDDKSHLILTVDRDGKIGEFSLDSVEYAAVGLSAGKVKISVITDVAWADGKVLAACRGNETFASKIFSIDAPLSHEATGNIYSAETYHVSHRRWETKAPMSVLIPFKEGDKTYVVGAFSCTPVVKYPLDAVSPGAKIKGTSVIELGSGNRPIDMIVYEKAGKPYV
ncbi:MAG: hypothetical protein N2C14_29875, partial [Planctomycetales bacterium]